MISEYSILTDITASLGTYRLNRETPSTKSQPKPTKRSPATSTGNAAEAELLLKFMATAPKISDTLHINDSETFTKPKAPKTPEQCRASIISPSFSFEAKRIEKKGEREHYGNRAIRIGASTSLKPKLQRQCADSKNTFTLCCPSLALQSDSTVLSTTPSPAYLFSRPIRTQPISIDDIKLGDIADTLASNVVQSFNTAMTWRAKTWIKALSRVLSIRYQVEKSKLASTKKGAFSRSRDDNFDPIKDELKKSHEARVISALTKASSTAVVHDVRTTFFILEQQLNSHQDHQGQEKKDNDNHRDRFTGLPPLKRRRMVSGEIGTPTPYNLSHAIILDTRCSVSTSPLKKMSLHFRTPGAIHGTFFRDRNGNVQLQNVSITLDTEALALAMDENSRRVMRAATEEYMVSPPINYCTIYDTVQAQSMAREQVSGDISDSTPEPEEDLDSQRYYSDRLYESYFYNSPTVELDSHGPLVTPIVQDTTYETSVSYKMALPRSLPLEDGRHAMIASSTFLNPRRVSPTDHYTASSSDPFASPTPTKETSVVVNGLSTADRQFLVPPSLVSPYNPIGDDVDQPDELNAPTMPALLEVACAAHAKCH
jgi:hypothetical protein